MVEVQCDTLLLDMYGMVASWQPTWFLWLHSAWCDRRLTGVLSLGSREITIAMSPPLACCFGLDTGTLDTHPTVGK